MTAEDSRAMTPGDPFDVLRSSPPALDVAAASALLREHYAVDGRLEPLVSERDQNFLVSGNDRRFVLKITNAAEDPAVTDLQNQALRHIARVSPAFPAPRIVASRAGDLCIECVGRDGRTHRVRLLTWLDGVPLDESPRSAQSIATLARCLAELDRLLRDFDHPASDHALLWDLKQAASLRELLRCVDDADLRRLCERRLDTFEQRVAPALSSLRQQVIHNDMNPDNVLVDGDDPTQVRGIIDYGDIVRSPLIIDVAVACAYLLRDDAEPLADVESFIAAYHAHSSLLPEEVALLFDLLLTRSTTTILVSYWRADRYPDNRDYIFGSVSTARGMLQAADRMNRDAVADRWMRRASIR